MEQVGSGELHRKGVKPWIEDLFDRKLVFEEAIRILANDHKPRFKILKGGYSNETADDKTLLLQNSNCIGFSFHDLDGRLIDTGGTVEVWHHVRHPMEGQS
jgi:hypothetical protein